RVLDEPTLFPMVRSVELDPAAELDFTVLVRTGESSWAERDLDAWRTSGRAELGENDLLGPVPIAVAGTPRLASEASAAGRDGDADGEVASDGSEEGEGAEAPPKTPRLVVFGDSDFVTNQTIDDLRNRDLFVNSINWLAG